MQLVRCYVENFGKLSDVNLDFRSGMHVLCRENGWGKSTLAVFICAMFYGLANDRKHGEADNERKHYMPWQGGTFGGNLTFSNEKGTFTIYRTFGKKAREDTFELRDTRTNLRTDIYSEEIGAELFQLDRESFIRTAFLFQDSCETLATSGINAKIHNLAEDTNDMNNYDRVNRRLLAEMSALGENRATGTLARMKAQEQDLKEAVSTGPIWERKLRELTERKEQLQRKAGETAQQQEQLLQMQNQQEYRRAEEEARERKAVCEGLMTFFHGSVPTDQELEEQHALLRKAETLRKQRGECSFSQEELEELEELDRKFGEDLPSDQELQKQYDNLDRIDLLRQKIESLQEEIGETPDQSDDYEDNPERQEAPDDTGRGWFTAFCLIISGIVLVFIGLMAMKLFSPTAGTAVVLFGAVLIAGIFYYLASTGRVKLRPVAGNLRRAIPGFMNRGIARVDADPEEEAEKLFSLQEAEEEINQLELSIREFLSVYTDDELIYEELEEELAAIDTEADRYRQLSERSRKYRELTALLRETIIQQNAYLRRYLPARRSAGRDEISAEARLRRITAARAELDHARDEYRRAREKAELLKEKTEERTGKPITGWPETGEPFTVEELSSRLRRTSNLRLEQQKALQECSFEIEKVQKARDEAAVFAGELEKLQDAIAKKQHEYEVLRLTQEILAEARNTINAKYMKPIMHSFMQYFQIINPEEADRFYIDGDSRITVLGGGKQRDSSILSKGYQDMIGLCIRLALLDAMYPAEKPFLVMDDPLVNLDDVRLYGGIDFLRTISGKYQIIYLTCHEEMASGMDFS